ncbi:MAG: PQQ-binding-like beta-propeller repeat protein [Planctomycetaceae bacterium]|nr:PQQ-binding-like beta-propeller repeat protein [Planctomycetaceae bacterium]
MLTGFSSLRWVSLSVCLTWTAVAVAAPADVAKEIQQATGFSGGFVVHLGCGDGALTAALRLNDGVQVQGLDTDAAKIATARAAIRKTGAYGDVCVDRFDGKSLPYIDGFVNLVVAEDLGQVTVAEIERVLCPNGVGYVKQNGAWTKIVKPWPKDIDDWTHYFHDSTGNPVAHDTVVDTPERLQWVGSPRYSRHHDRMASMSALVSSQGRLYYIMDEGSRVNIELPSKWHLIARDAFNGTVLWKAPIPKWHDQMWPLKSGPTQLARRLVADQTDVYVTLGLHEPVSRVNGLTGATEHVYEGTGGAEEILYRNGVLFVLVNPAEWELDKFAPKLNTGDQGRVATEFTWNESPREIHAIDAKSGKLLWKHTSKVAPLSIAINDTHLVFHDGDKIVCFEPKSGEPKWTTEPAPRRKSIQFNFGPRLVLHDTVVLYAGGDGKMRGHDPANGKTLWESEHAPSGYQSPQDLIVTGGLVWVAPTTSGRDSGIYKGRDLLTGSVKVEFPPDIDTYWFHHRCYIAKGTDRYIIPSRTGIEFVDFNTKHWDINHWVRGGCLYGVLPCNGLTYAPPHDCACYPEAKLYGLNALAPKAKTPVLLKVIPEEGRLEQGPAYTAKLNEAAATKEEWPTYRHDNQRSGGSDHDLGKNLDRAWEVKLDGKLTPLTIAGGLVYVAQVDQHTLHALDAKTGDSKWTYTAGGRIDSPPTFWKGRLVFGCVDGWVYCLRAADGALIWRYRGAPVDRRLMSFEQLESVWPVHGSVLVEQDVAHFVVGRSSFLDGGMWYLRLDPRTGKKLSETVLNDRDPKTGKDIQERLQTLQMPVGLNDLLCSDGTCVFLKSQKFTLDGERQEIGPISGEAAVQGGTQTGEGRHIFAPMGFLDDTWYHRSYWVYGKNFAGGHNGYYQAGKHTPTGRILVFNEKTIYGYSRQPQYHRWTTPLEHQLFAADRDAAAKDVIAPQPNNPNAKKNKKNAPPAGNDDTVSFGMQPSFNPANKAFSVEAWVNPQAPGGVILAHGGPSNGYALVMTARKPAFVVRAANALAQVEASTRLKDGWNHVVGVLGNDKSIAIYVNGELAARGHAPELIPVEPKQSLDIGGDSASAVGEYASPFNFVGSIDEVRIFHRELSAPEIAAAFKDPQAARESKDALALHVTFDTNVAKDLSGHGTDGVMGKLPTGPGRLGAAVVFPKPAGNAVAQTPANPTGPTSNSPTANPTPQMKQVGFEHDWTKFVPVFARAMLLANDTLMIAGPPDLVDSEYALERLAAKDPAIREQLQQQDDSLEGKLGGKFWVVNTKDGSQTTELQLDCLPTWDGMSTAYGRIYIATTDGRVICMGRE